MDYNDQSVGICCCCVFFTFKHYIYFVMSTNGVQGIVLSLIGLFGLFEQFELFVFQRPITLAFLCLGITVILGLVFQFVFWLRHSVLIIGKFMVLINVLTSLFDLLVGTFLLLSLFIQLSFIQFNESQISFSATRRTVLLVVSIIIIILSFFGLWMTYLQYQTIAPLQELLTKETKVVPVVSLRQAISRRFTKNFIGDLTPQNGKQVKLARADSTSDNSQPQRAQPKFSPDDNQEPYTNRRSEKFITMNGEKPYKQIPETVSPENEFYAPSTNTIRLPNGLHDDIQQLRKQRTPRTTLLNQKNN